MENKEWQRYELCAKDENLTNDVLFEDIIINL